MEMFSPFVEQNIIEIDCVAYSSSVLDFLFPSAYCDELANCAIEFIVEYPCLDRPLLNEVGAVPADDDCGCADVAKLPAF